MDKKESDANKNLKTNNEVDAAARAENGSTSFSVSSESAKPKTAKKKEVSLHDMRIKELQKAAGVKVDKAPPAPKVIKFEDADEEDEGEISIIDFLDNEPNGIIEFVNEDVYDEVDYLNKPVDSIVKKFITESKKKAKAVPPDEPNAVIAHDESYLDASGAGTSEEAKKEIDGFAREVVGDGLLGSIFNAVCAGRSKVAHDFISEAIVLDDEWINTISNGLHFVEEIVKNPRKFIIDNDLIIEVEKAKKTTSKTVRHLAQNTKNISRIEDDGFVMPKKLLTTEIDEDLAIYENRFVNTLIMRLIAFVESRKTDIQSKFRMHDISRFALSSEYKFGSAQVECNVMLSVREKTKDTVQLNKAMMLMEKINEISKRLKILKASSFVRALSTLKPIVPPISKTNIIRMNVNYATCYKLWLYISAYTFVGYSVEVKEKRLPVDGDYFDDMTSISALSLHTVICNERINRKAYENIIIGEPKKKTFKLINKLEIAAAAKDGNITVKDEAVNEYFFRKMQEAAHDAIAAETSDEDDEKAEKANTKKITVNFERFCKSLMHISNGIYSEIIDRETDRAESRIHETSLRRKKKQLDIQKEVVKRLSVISKIKAQDLEQVLNNETRETRKLEKLQAELIKLEEAKAKPKKKKAAAPKKAASVKEKAIKKAKDYKEKLLDKEEAAKERARLIKEAKREQRIRERELRVLATLKTKYESEEIE